MMSRELCTGEEIATDGGTKHTYSTYRSLVSHDHTPSASYQDPFPLLWNGVWTHKTTWSRVVAKISVENPHGNRDFLRLLHMSSGFENGQL